MTRSVSHNFLKGRYCEALVYLCLFIIYLCIYLSNHLSICLFFSPVYLYPGESCQRGAARPLLQRASREGKRLRPRAVRQQRPLRIEHQQQPISNFASFTTATTGTTTTNTTTCGIFRDIVGAVLLMLDNCFV